MIRLRDQNDYDEIKRELIALEEICDGVVRLSALANAHSALRPNIENVLDRLITGLKCLRDAEVDPALTLRREAVNLFEELHDTRRPSQMARPDGHS